MLHHSDQGGPYASEDYQKILEAQGITCSMSRRGNCYDNAVMESFFSTVKSDLADRFESFAEAKMELFDYLEVFYKQRRRHSTLGQVSPAAFAMQNAVVESYNGRMRDECLNVNWWSTIEGARRGIRAHRIDYNEVRPHGALNNRTPSEFARALRERDPGVVAA